VSEPLGPTAAIITPGAVEKVTRTLARLGYLCDVEVMNGDVHISAEPDV
jgi:hypothetical protein